MQVLIKEQAKDFDECNLKTVIILISIIPMEKIMHILVFLHLL
jgi:hypothetical protein